MGRHYRIRVYGKQRKNIDPALLAQVVILFGRHLHQQQQAATTTGHSKLEEDRLPQRRDNPVMAQPEPPSREGTPQAPTEASESSDGEGGLP